MLRNSSNIFRVQAKGIPNLSNNSLHYYEGDSSSKTRNNHVAVLHQQQPNVIRTFSRQGSQYLNNVLVIGKQQLQATKIKYGQNSSLGSKSDRSMSQANFHHHVPQHG